MSLPSRAGGAAGFSGFFSSQVQLSGNSPAEAGSMPQMSEPKAIRRIFFALMLHGLSQPALADNGESLRQAEELKPVRIRVYLCSCVTDFIWLAFLRNLTTGVARTHATTTPM